MHPRLEIRRSAVAAAKHANRRPAGSPRLTPADANRRSDELLAAERARLDAKRTAQPPVRWQFIVALAITVLVAMAVTA